MKRLIWKTQTKAVLKHTLGWICIALGLVMLITPGQGVLTILIGVYLLADHIPAFGRLKTRMQRRFPKMTEYIQHKGDRFKTRRRRDDGH